jgi:hypothetical protein
VTTAPASADIRNDSNGAGFCCAPNVPGLTPAGSTLLVRHRIATGVSDVKRNAPAEPTGRPSSESRTSTTSRILPAGTVNVRVKGSGLAFWLAWKATETVASVDAGLKKRPSVRKKVELRPFARATPLTRTSWNPSGRSSKVKSELSPVTLSTTTEYPAARPRVTTTSALPTGTAPAKLETGNCWKPGASSEKSREPSSEPSTP